MKVLVIGGTGHVGSFLVPMLLNQGHEVYIGSRGKTAPREDSPLKGATFVTCNSNSLESLQSLRDYRFDVVVDFPGTAYNVWKAFKDTAEHIIACGSLWMFGYPYVVPTPELRQTKCPFEGYESRYLEIQEMIGDSGKEKAVFTAIMPPNICGPGKIPLECLGGRDINVHKAHKAGEKVYLPDGPEALIGPCDAEDIASLFALAVNNRTAAAGNIFNVGSAYSVTSSQMVKIYAEIYNVDIPIEKVSWEKYEKEISPSMGHWWHFYAHMQPDITKAQKLLGYAPKYTPKQTLERAVNWMRKEGLI